MIRVADNGVTQVDGYPLWDRFLRGLNLNTKLAQHIKMNRGPLGFTAPELSRFFVDARVLGSDRLMHVDRLRYDPMLAQSYGLETATWPVVPLFLHPVEQLPPRLAMLTALDATDPDRWPDVVERLCAELQCPVPGPAPALAGPDAPRKKARSIANILTTQKISVEFKKASLDQFVKFIRTATGINIVVNKRQIEKDGGDVDAIEIALEVKNVKVIDALKLALQGHELGLKVKGNILYITSKKDALGKPVLRIASMP